jgi:hypothetical protein
MKKKREMGVIVRSMGVKRSCYFNKGEIIECMNTGRNDPAERVKKNDASRETRFAGEMFNRRRKLVHRWNHSRGHCHG